MNHPSVPPNRLKRAAGPPLAKAWPSFAALLLFLWASAPMAEEIWGVASPAAAVTALTPGELADIFLGRADESRFCLQAIDQKDETLRQRFYRAVTGLSLQSLRAYWARQVFTGRGRPPRQMSLEESWEALTRLPNAITYLPEGSIPETGKVLLILPGGDSP